MACLGLPDDVFGRQRLTITPMVRLCQGTCERFCFHSSADHTNGAVRRHCRFFPPSRPRLQSRHEHLLPALAVAFAAFYIRLTVRIVNRRERWRSGRRWASSSYWWVSDELSGRGSEYAKAFQTPRRRMSRVTPRFAMHMTGQVVSLTLLGVCQLFQFRICKCDA